MTKTFTPAELAKIHADLAACEREAAINEAARKVADAAVVWSECDDLGLASDVIEALETAVREYRAVIAPPLSNQSAIDAALERLTDEGKLEEVNRSK